MENQLHVASVLGVAVQKIVVEFVLGVAAQRIVVEFSSREEGYIHWHALLRILE